MDIGKCLPNKIFAVTAEGGVFEEPWYELVILDLGDVLLLEGPLPGPEPGGVHHLLAGPGADGSLRVAALRHPPGHCPASAARRIYSR